MEISFDEIRNVDSFGVGQNIIVAMTPKTYTGRVGRKLASL